MFKPISDEYDTWFKEILSDLSPHQVCTKCGEIQPYSAFCKDKKTKNGLKQVCRPCCSQMEKDRCAKYKQENTDKDVSAVECNKCHLIKPRSEYQKDSSKKNGLRTICRPCTKTSQAMSYQKHKNIILKKRALYVKKNKHIIAEYRQKNKTRIREKDAAWRKNNAAWVKKRTRAYYDKNRARKLEYHAEYIKKNKTRLKVYWKEYREKNKKRYAEHRIKNKVHLRKLIAKNKQENKTRYAQKRRVWYNKKIRIDLNFKLQRVLRSRIHTALKRKNTLKNSRTMELVGCSVAKFREHIENQFAPGMQWANHGLHGWHLVCFVLYFFQQECVLCLHHCIIAFVSI